MQSRFLVGALAVLATAACFCGSPKAEQDGPKAKPTQPAAGDASEESEVPKVRDLGPPLVDDINELKKLDKASPVWLDAKRKQVVLLGEVCRASYGLEFFATLPGRDYEAVVVVDVKPRIVHAGLLAVGAEPGHTARFEPKFEPPSGTEIEILVRWKDKDGKRQQARAQDWIRDMKTKKALDAPFVFAGSGFWQDETTGKRIYQADGGDFISVSNVPLATIDVPIKSSSALESRMFEGFVDRLPPKGTPVTLILAPKLPKKP